VGLSEFLLVSADEFARFGAGLRSGVRVGPVVSAREFAAELRDELLLLGAWPFGLFRGGWRRAGRRAVAEVAGPPRFVVEASHVLRSRRSRASGVRSSTWRVVTSPRSILVVGPVRDRVFRPLGARGIFEPAGGASRAGSPRVTSASWDGRGTRWGAGGLCCRAWGGGRAATPGLVR
jgi:hypothetical protein